MMRSESGKKKMGPWISDYIQMALKQLSVKRLNLAETESWIAWRSN